MGEMKAKMLPLFTRPHRLKKGYKNILFFHAFLPLSHIFFLAK